MLVIRESTWQRAARVARTPAFGVAAAAYLITAWIGLGASASPEPPADVPMAHNAGTAPRTAPRAGLDGVPNSRRPDESNGLAPEIQIDPQNFAALQRALSDVDEQASNQLYYPQPRVDEVSHLPAQPGGPVPDALSPEASAIVPPPPAVVNPDGQIVDAPVVDPSVPAASGVAPPPVVVNPNGQIVDAPVVDPSVPAASGVAPPPAVVNPNGQAAGAVNQQPLGPAPGPAV